MNNKNLFYGFLILVLVATIGVILFEKTTMLISPTTPTPQPTPILPKEEFCGSSTYGKCNSNEDCHTGGCSGQICQSKNEEPIITTCEWQDCYDAKKYQFECLCLNKQCQWHKIIKISY